MKKMIIYVDVMHFDFWWGIYGFCNNTSWEDIILYRKWGNGYRKLGWTCICTRPYFESALEDLKDDPDEKEFVKEIAEFLDGCQIKYNYFYDKVDDTDFYEVLYEAQRNEYNIKPRSIETWYPSNGVDKNVLYDCVKIFCKKFLGIEVNCIEFKEVISFEDALESYMEHMKIWEENPKIVFSDSLIEQMQSEMGISKEKVLEILNRGIKQ